MNNLGRGPLGEATLPNMISLALPVSDKKIFEDFSYMSLGKTSDPRGGTIFDPNGYTLNKLDKRTF